MRSHRTLGALAVAAMIAASGTAFTAGNTIDDHTAGTGGADISGVSVTDISYGLDGEKTTVETVTFTHTDGDLGEVDAQLSFDDGANWNTCVADATTVTCSNLTQGLEAAQSLTLVVVADGATVPETVEG